MKRKIKYLSIVLIAALVGMVEVANAFYDPGLQRWIFRDPLGESGGVNLFSFVANNPQNKQDAFGQCPLANPWNAEAYAPGSTFLSGRPGDVSLGDYLQFVGGSIAAYMAAAATLGLAGEALFPIAVESATGVIVGEGAAVGTIGMSGSLASTLGTELTTTTVGGLSSLVGAGTTVIFPNFAAPTVWLWGSSGLWGASTMTGTLMGGAAIAFPSLFCTQEEP